jgi:glycosyltransferase involved in cell wall biosynthesis
MKICILTTNLNHGGVSINAQDMARGMAQKGHDVLFVCSDKNTISYTKDGYRVQVLSVDFQNPAYHYFNPLLIAKFYNLLRRFRPDILHVHNINLQTFSLVTLLISLKYPMIWTLHDVWPLCMVGWPNPPDCNQLYQGCNDCQTWPALTVKLNKIIKEIIFRFSRMHVVCPSNWLLSLLKMSNLGLKTPQVIHYGIDPLIFSPSKMRDELKSSGISDRKKVLLFSGGKKLAGQLPAERKGWGYLASALEILTHKRTDMRLIYVGDPIALPANFPVEVCFKSGIDRNDMIKYYNMADLFILPTLADNLPLTILEAMASKVPIISSGIGGIPEMIIPGETGLLCTSRNATALAETIDYALSNTSNCSEMAEKAYQRFNEMFTFDRMLDHYEDAYIQTIENS